MSPDEQEALSRRFGDDIIILLPLKSGNVAVFNAARELCAVLKQVWVDNLVPYPYCWHPPTKVTKVTNFTLEDLGL